MPTSESARGTRLAALELSASLGNAHGFGDFIDTALVGLGHLLGSELATFNRLNMRTRQATIVTRPFRQEVVVASDQVNTMLLQHPMLRWAPRQSVWPVVRLSDVATPTQLAASPLYCDVLRPFGAAFSLFIFVSPTQGPEWTYFVANRSDVDFGQDDVDAACLLQPALVALMGRWSPGSGSRLLVPLTERERVVLRSLAAGLTAEAMARSFGLRPATVRKHLQNTYGKLGVRDRLSAVMRARELGILDEDDLGDGLAERIQLEMSADVTPDPGESDEPLNAALVTTRN